MNLYQQNQKKKAKETKQQQLIKARKAKQEDKQQKIKNDIQKVSRLLDNYYDPKIHRKTWSPNGKIKAKNTYYYNRDTGLAFNLNSINNYKKSNNNSNSNSNKEGKTIKKQIHFLEFDYLENNEVVITIEHCNNCEDHLSHTNHINNIYRHFSKILQRVILLRFPFIKVYLKPIDTNSNNDIRLGAMEIQYASKLNDEVKIIPLHSMLNSGQWPSIYNILNKLSSLVPLIHLKCIVYDKEEGLIDAHANADEIDDILPTSVENIKVNLYLARNELIEGFSIEAMDELDKIYDPRRRHYAYYEKFEQEKQATLEANNSMTMQSSTLSGNKYNSNAFKSRPSTSKPFTATNSTSNYSRVNPSTSSTLKANSTYNKLSTLETINDPDTIAKQKGKLLLSGYTDNAGTITFQNLPYDTYLIEIEASKNYLMNGALTCFNKLISSTSKEKNSIVTINKYLGLLHQIDSYVEVYIYSSDNENENGNENVNGNGNETEMNYNLVGDAKVFLLRSYELSSNSLFPPGEDKLEVKEKSSIKGRYEIITSPGRVLLEVNKIGYEPIKKEINLRTGENKINIELSNN